MWVTSFVNKDIEENMIFQINTTTRLMKPQKVFKGFTESLYTSLVRFAA